MAVSLPSDLIADVMRNADPARRNAAVARLQSIDRGSTSFAATVDQAGEGRLLKASPEASTRRVMANAPAGVPEGTDDNSATFRGFERMVLRNMFESMLPEQESGAFGGGPSAGVWRSMAAEQLAGTVAEQGGIGIARMAAASGDAAMPRRDAQWPYFSLHPLRAPGSEG